jgi:hypothetical protein
MVNQNQKFQKFIIPQIESLQNKDSFSGLSFEIQLQNSLL